MSTETVTHTDVDANLIKCPKVIYFQIEYKIKQPEKVVFFFFA